MDVLSDDSVFWPDSGSPLQAEIGTKALNLTRGLRAGLLVPAFCVLSTKAFVSALHVTATYRSFCSLFAPGSGKGRNRVAVAARVRGALTGLEFSTQDVLLVKDLRRRLWRGAAAPCAVRSSSTVEDHRGRSLAGHFGSVIGPVSALDLLDAIRRVWCSMFTEAPVVRLGDSSGCLTTPKMAVVLQALVPASVAGVAIAGKTSITRNDHVLIEANWGLGDTVVSGAVGPDRILYSKTRGAVVKRTKGTTLLKSVLRQDADRGTYTDTEACSDEERSAFCLAPAEEEAIAEACIRVEAVFGEAVNVEWAIKDGEVFIVQVRPAT